MPKKILVVDNSKVILKLMSNLLKKEGYDVVTALDGISALYVLKNFVPDVIFIDLIMPRIDGKKLCKIIRNNQNLKQVKIVIFSALAAEEIDIKELEADYCIAKGAFKKTSEHIKAVLHEISTDSESTLSKKILGIEEANKQEISTELLDSKKHLEVILSNISEGIVELNLDYEIIYANTLFISIAGRDEEELLGTNFLRLFNNKQNSIIQKQLDSLGRSYHENLKKPLLTFKNRHISFDFLLCSDKGEKSIVVILRDITESKRVEQELKNRANELEQSHIAAVQALAGLAEIRDTDTGDHLNRVAEYSKLIATELAKRSEPKWCRYITQRYIEDICQSSILHDIGKVGIPDMVLLKPSALTPEEFDLMKQHTVIGGEAIKKAVETLDTQTFLSLGKEIAYFHHEKFDGSGYPMQLKGEDIPLSARIVAIADVYDAMTSDRPYKKALSHDMACRIIFEEMGENHFDPVVLEIFRKMEPKFHEISNKTFPEDDSLFSPILIAGSLQQTLQQR